jgi:hypothetical protein
MNAGILENGVMIARFTAPLSINSNVNYFVSDTLSLQRRVYKTTPQRWEIAAGIEPSNTSADFLVNIVTKGFDQIVDVRMPQVYRRSGGTTATSSITATGSVGASTITISGNNGTIAKGEFVQFSNHDKVYMVTQNSSGGSLSIFPQLTTAISSSNMKYGSNVIFKGRYETDSFVGIQYVDGILSDPGIIKLIEVI